MNVQQSLKMGRGSNVGEAFSFSGILKIVEIVLLLIAIILHRHGDNGGYIFFATADQKIQYVSLEKRVIYFYKQNIC